jgi:hypothetical protein
MVLAAALPTLFFAAAAWTSYRDAVADAWTRVDRSARVGVEHASKVLETNETIGRHISARSVPRPSSRRAAARGNSTKS